MQEICSCGTQLVENALFCHRCGKAQRELLAPDPEADVVANPASMVVAPPANVPVPIAFSNRLAVRLCFLVASVASVLDAMPVLQLFSVIWAACGGFIAVLLYRRATGQPLNIRDGAKLGWITGVFNSLIFTVLTTLAIATNSDELNAQFHEQIRNSATKYDAATLAMLDNPYMLAAVIFILLFLAFIFVSGACVAGGALGARVIRDDRAPDHQPR